MATKCPNKNSVEWKTLVNALGEDEAYRVFLANNEEVPELDIINNIITAYKNTPIKVNLLSKTKYYERAEETGYSPQEEYHIVNVIGNILVDVAKKYEIITLKDIKEGKAKNIRDEVNLAFNLKLKDREQFLTKEQAQFSNRVSNDIKYNGNLWRKIQRYAERNFGYVIKDDEKLNEEYLEKNWNENAAFSDPSSDNIRRDLKLFISTIPLIDQSSVSEVNGEFEFVPNTITHTGLYETLEFSNVYPKLSNEMIGSINDKEMLNRLYNLGTKFDPTYLQIWQRLNSDKTLLNAWYSDFDQQKLERCAEIYRKTDKGFVIDTIITNRSAFQEYNIADNWLLNLEQLASNYQVFTSAFNLKFSTKLNEIKNHLNSQKDYINTDVIAESIASLYSELGFNMPTEAVNDVLNSETVRSRVPKYEEPNASDIEIQNYITNEITTKQFLNLLEKLKDYAVHKTKFIGNKNISEPTFNQVAAVNNLAGLVKTYIDVKTEFSSLTVTNNNVYATQKPDFLSDIFKRYNDYNSLLEWGKTIQNIPTFQNSNWIWNVNNDGLFNFTEKEGIKFINERDPINTSFVQSFKLQMYEGGKNATNNDGQEYTDQSNNDWTLTRLTEYFKGVKNKADWVRSFVIIPSDRGNIRLINHKRVKLNAIDYKNLIDSKNSEALKNKFKETEIFKAVKNTVDQEIERIKQATEFVFINNDVNQINKDNEKYFILNYHYKLDDKGNRIYLDNKNEPVGNAFKFQNMWIDKASLNDDKYDLFHNGIIYDKMLTAEDYNTIDNFIIDFLRYEVGEDYKRLSIHTDKIKSIHTGFDNTEVALADFTINQFIANVEMQNLFGLVTSFYKNYEDTNKRATQLEANGKSQNSNDTFRALTIADVYKQNKYFDPVNTADGASIISLKGFKKRVQNYGEYEKYKPIIDALEKGTRLKPTEIRKAIAPLKEFYYGYEYNSKVNAFVPKQLKNANTLVHPLIYGETQMSDLAKWMDENDVDQINFESAVKVGAEKIVRIHDDKGNITLTDDIKKEMMDAVVEYSYSNLRKQQELPNDTKDHKNILGKQIERIILNNIRVNAKFKIGDKIITGAEIKDKYFDVLVQNINESSDNVLLELGATFDDKGEVVEDEFGNIVIDKYKFYDILRDNITMIDDNISYILEKGLPLFDVTLQNRFISVSNSLFTNNVIRQEFPGAHLAQITNVFMAPGTIKLGEKDYNKSFRKLKYTENKSTGVSVSEVILPAWTKKFFTEDDTIEDIENIPEELRTMLAYRIPTEAKYSIIVFKVVGFTPEELGPVVVLPDEFIAQSGSDFDLDSVYTMEYSFRTKIEDGKKVYEKIEYQDKIEDEDKLLMSYLYRRAKYDDVAKDDINRIISIREEEFKAIKRLITNKKISITVNKKLKQPDVEQKKQLFKDYKEKENILKYLDKTFNELSEEKEYMDDLSNDFSNSIKDKIDSDGIDTRRQDYLSERLNRLNQNIEEIKNELASIDVDLNEIIDKLNLRDELIQDKQDIIEDTRELHEKAIASILAPYKKLFSQFPLERKNTLKARNNRILDIYIAILTSKKGFEEAKQTSNFEDIKSAKARVDKAAGRDKIITNPATVRGQDMYRQDVMEGRTLKGFSVNRDGFLSFAQVTRLELSKSYGFKQAYKIGVDTQYDITTLKKMFGKNNVEDKGNGVVVINHRRLGHSGKNNFFNIKGKLITSYSAQATANILDNVKHKLPRNFNSYTFEAAISYVNTGGSWDYVIALINQPSIIRLADNFFDDAGLTGNNTGNEFKNVMNFYTEGLFKAMDRAGQFKDLKGQDNKTYKRLKQKFIDKNPRAFVKYEDMNKLLGVNFKEFNIQTTDDLLDNITFATEMSKHNSDKNYDGIVNYYRNQINALIQFNRAKQTSDAITRAVRVFNTDKQQVGPDFENIESLDVAMIALPNIFRINNMNAIEAVYNFRNIQTIMNYKSEYSMLDAYYNMAHVRALKTFGQFFITRTKAASVLKDSILSVIPPKNRTEDVIRKINNYIGVISLEGNDFFNLNVEEKERILGINSGSAKGINLKDNSEETHQKFDELSTADKINLIKIQLQDYIKPDDTTHILNFLETDTTEETLNTRGYQGIRFINNDKVDYMINTYNNLWYNDGNYAYYLNSLGRDLLKYSYIIEGLTFSYTGLSKVTPVNIKNDEEVNLINHIDSKFQAYKGDERINDYFVKFFQNNIRSNKLVPTVSKRTKTIEEQNEDGDVVVKVVNDPEYPVWEPNIDNIIVIPRITVKESIDYQGNLKKEEIELLSNESVFIQNAPLINIPIRINKTMKMAEPGQFEKVAANEKTQTTRLKKNNYKAGDTITIWNGKKGDDARYINAVVTAIKHDTASNILSHIESLPNNDEHFKREGREGTPIIHIGNLKKLGFTEANKDKQAQIIQYKVLTDSLVTNKPKNLYKSRPYKKVDLDAYNNIYYIPVSELNGYETTERSFIEKNNPDYAETDYLNIIEQYEKPNLGQTEIKFSVTAKQSYEESIAKLLEDFRIDSLKDLSKYKHAGSEQYLKYVRNHNNKVDRAIDIESYTLRDLREALVHTIRFNHSMIYGITPVNKEYKGFKDIGILSRMQDWKNFNFEEDENPVETRRKLISFLHNTRNFIVTFSHVEEVRLYNKEDEAGISDEIKKIQSLIKILKEQYQDVKGLEIDIKQLQREQIERDIKPLTSNPEILHGVKDFFEAGLDENWYQLMLDSLFDTHVPVAANFVKWVRIEMEKKTTKVKKLTGQFEDELEEYKASGLSEDMLFEMYNNKRTGRIVQKYNRVYWDQLHEHYAKLADTKKEFGEESIEFYNAVHDYKKWRLANTEQKYKEEYYKDQLLISPAAALKRDELAKEERSIIYKYKGLSGYRSFDISADDKQRLDDISQERRKELRGEGELSEADANSWKAYNEAMGKYYGLENNQDFLEAFNKAKGKQKNLDEFLVRNTRPSKQFWDRYKSMREEIKDLSQQLFGVKSNKEFEEIQALLEPYKDRDGLLNVMNVPADVMKEVKTLLDLAKESTSVGGEFDKKLYSKLKDLKRQLNAYARVVPSDYYYQELEKQTKLLKEGENIEDTAWYRDNHMLRDEEFVPINIWTTVYPRTVDVKYIEEKKEDGTEYKGIVYTGIIPNKHWTRQMFIEDKHNNPNYEEDYRGRPVPKPHWINEQYKSVQNNPKAKKFYDFLTGLLADSMSHYSDSIIHQGYLPAIAIDNRKGMKGFLQREIEKAGWYDLNKDYDTLIYDKSGREVKQVPLSFVSKVKPLPIYEIPKRELNEPLDDYKKRVLEFVNEDKKTQFKSYEKLIKYNEGAEKFNKKLVGSEHGENISYDLETIIPAAISTFYNHQAKKNIEKEVLLFGSHLDEMEFKRVNSLGKVTKDYFESKVRKDKDAETKIENSNVGKHFRDWVDRYFYQDWENDEGTWTKASKVLQNYVSKKGIGLNPFSAMNNLVYGRIQTMIESGAGYHYNIKDLGQGKLMWNANVMSFVADTWKDDGKSSTYVNGLARHFDVLMDSTEMFNRPDGKMQSELKKKLMKVNAWFFMQTIGEHYMQNVTLFAMLHSHRLINGKVQSLEDYMNENDMYNLIDYRLPAKEIKKKYEEIDRLRKQRKDEFDKFPKLVDVYELHNGRIRVKKDYTLEDGEEEKFKLKVQGVNQKIHGIYNKEDKGMINRWALGRLAMQFRNWIRPGWTKRFGTKFGKSSWNERRNEWDKGMYTSMFEFMAIPFRKNTKRNWDSEHERTVFRAISAILRDYGKFIGNFKTYYHTLNDTDKANVKRSTMEFLYLLGTVILFNLLKALGDDDDEQGLIYNAMIYQLDRTKTELMTYSPLYGWFNESQKILKSPTATWRTYEDVYKLAHATFMYPVRSAGMFGLDGDDNYYENGIYDGRSRISVLSSRLIPGLTQWQRIQYLDKMNRYYKLF